MTLTSYSTVAEIWSLFFGDRTGEINFWFNLSHQYGATILSAMSATGEVADALALQGCKVTAVDFTREMIEEGRRKYGENESLTFVEADLRTFDLGGRKFDFAFIGNADFHHFLTTTDQLAALRRMRHHLRPGGGLGLELWFPSRTSWSSPWNTFEPLRTPADPAVKVWKKGKTEFDAETQLVTITQEVFIQRNDQIEQFPHAFQMQLFDRDSMIALLDESGFRVQNEYGSFQAEPWTPSSPNWIIEAVRE